MSSSANGTTPRNTPDSTRAPPMLVGEPAAERPQQRRQHDESRRAEAGVRGVRPNSSRSSVGR